MDGTIEHDHVRLLHLPSNSSLCPILKPVAVAAAGPESGDACQGADKALLPMCADHVPEDLNLIAVWFLALVYNHAAVLEQQTSRGAGSSGVGVQCVAGI